MAGGSSSLSDSSLEKPARRAVWSVIFGATAVASSSSEEKPSKASVAAAG